MCVWGGSGKTDSKPVNKQLQELISDNDKLWGDNNRLDDGTELDLWKREDRQIPYLWGGDGRTEA